MRSNLRTEQEIMKTWKGTKPVVSICCLAYNHEPYIEDALEGFLIQETDFPFEVLIHDDASTDRTADIIREYEAAYPHIIKPIYQSENQHSKNVRISATYQYPRAQGKYIAICEGDDYWTSKEKIQLQYNFMEKHPDYTLCATQNTWHDQETNQKYIQYKLDQDSDISVEDVIMEKNGRIFCTLSTFFRTQILKNLPEWVKEFPVGDYPMFVAAGMQGKIRMLATNTCVYRVNALNSWSANIYKKNETKIKHHKKMLLAIINMDSFLNSKYKFAIDYRILATKFEILLISKNWKEIKYSKQYYHLFNESFINKFKIYLLCNHTKLFKLCKYFKTFFIKNICLTK